MPLTIRKLHPLFAGEVTGVDLTRPLSGDQALAIEAAMDEYAVLVFPRQDITDEQQLAFAKLRAVEHDRYVVVAGTTGISTIIAPDGHEVARTEETTWPHTLDRKLPTLP